MVPAAVSLVADIDNGSEDLSLEVHLNKKKICSTLQQSVAEEVSFS
jgi:hypothetical protein